MKIKEINEQINCGGGEGMKELKDMNEELIKKANGCGITAAAYQDKLLSRLSAGQKAIDFIDQLIAEFQDGMHEKLFYELLNVYCGADPKPKQNNIGAKAITAMKQIDKLWQSNLTQDDFDKQLAVMLLKYRENRGEV